MVERNDEDADEIGRGRRKRELHFRTLPRDEGVDARGWGGGGM